MSIYDDMMSVSGNGGFTGAVGVDEIIGAVEEIVGAAAAEDIRRLALTRAAGGVGVRPQIRDKHRIQPAPFAATAVAASGVATVTIQPQRLIQILSLLVPSQLGSLFTITDIRVGQQTQFITTGVIPVSLVSEVANGDRSKFKFDSADIGNTVAVDIANLDTLNTQTFRAMVVADAVYG